MKKWILGLDPDSHNIGVAAYCPETHEWKYTTIEVDRELILGKAHYSERIRNLIDQFETWIFDNFEIDLKTHQPNIDHVYMELPEIQGEAKIHALQLLAFGAGALWCYLKTTFTQTSISLVNPSKWKGTLPKEKAQNRFKTALPKFWKALQGADEHALDGAMILLQQLNLFDPFVNVRKPERTSAKPTFPRFIEKQRTAKNSTYAREQIEQAKTAKNAKH